jgi:hypothetical protein
VRAWWRLSLSRAAPPSFDTPNPSPEEATIYVLLSRAQRSDLGPDGRFFLLT